MILIVDDTQENLFSLKTLLQLHSYEADTAGSGEDALKKVLRNEYSLIILDVQMPGMDGYEVAEAISGYSKTKDIPVIFLSAVNIDKRFITKGYAAGGVDYVTKPFDPDVLMLKVKTFSRLHEQKRELAQISEALMEEIAIRKKAQAAVEDANASLEKKVQERTADLLRMNKELELSNTELMQYASLASHDLQEPLRKIISFCNLIFEKHLESNEEAKHYFLKVISSAERMRNLINDLLNFSRLSAESVFIKASLSDIINETLSDLELLIEEKKAKVMVHDLPAVEIIPGQIRQLFQNLLSNSLKFAGNDVPPVIEISSRIISGDANEGDKVCISISDNGIGFDNTYRDKIFGIFQRLHRREVYDGTGIGLAIVKKIIEKHNGTITADGKPGAGATFTITLPVNHTTTI
jgi:signal transduction histidine kinase